MNTYFNSFQKGFMYFWQVILFLWIAFTATYDWVKCLFPLFFINGLIEQLTIFSLLFFFTPLLWWQALIVAFLPMSIAIPVLVCGLLAGLLFVTQSIVVL